MYCANCGAKNNDDAAFCNNCGTQFATTQAAPQQVVKKVKEKAGGVKSTITLIVKIIITVSVIFGVLGYIISSGNVNEFMSFNKFRH